jgi:phthiocerol/phenolphthiocerol synthesis type-I polyketide synthase E
VDRKDSYSGPVAIVGMALRVPGSTGLDDFWSNLCDGTESITRFDEDELREAGIPEAYLRDPQYVRAKPVLEDVAEFDAGFFGMTPREAQVRDPQHRLFLESAYTALEHAGYDPLHVPGAVGVFGGGAPNFYREWNVNSHPEAAAVLGDVGVILANAPDYLTTAVSHRLGLTGPSVNVATACSTALVAVHLACQALRTGECDTAIAGGVQVELPRRTGYHAAEGGMFSLTGRIRPFDARADGTIFGTGVGTVVLKRWPDALAAGDHVHAVIHASAVNNDGATKSGFTAPSVPGQAALIRTALSSYGIDPGRIGYVEAHGTGTRIGDPIEVTALTRAYRDLGMTGVRRIPIGSVKGNIGHLGPAAGVVGLIKAVLTVRAGHIPPSINFSEPNPEIDFDGGPFYVATEPEPWPEHQNTRLAGVSSFGVGGTNAHVVVGEPPAAHQPVPPAAPDARRPVVLALSARTPEALAAARRRLADHLQAHPEPPLADVAATLAHGRPRFAHRTAVVAAGDGDAPRALREAPAPSAATTAGEQPTVGFLFPGQGSQHPGMGRELYEREPVFREVIDRCAELAEPLLGEDLREVMFAAAGAADAGAADPDAAERLKQTRLAQPALFAVEYALARQLDAWGLTPSGMVGHSVGEYAAACVAGVFSLPDAVRLVVRRGQLVQELPGGAMMAVPLPADELRDALKDVTGAAGADVAAYNGERLTVVSGPHAAIDAAAAALAERGVTGTRLHTSHAFHSAMMEPALDAFAAELAEVTPHPPRLPFVSNVTGDWITDAEATDPAYWVRQLREPVRFAPSVALLLKDAERLLVEVGPGQVLTRLARAQAVAAGSRDRVIEPAMPLPRGEEDGALRLARTMAALWCAGLEPDGSAYWGEPGRDRRRVPLPAYPFERQVHWLDPVESSSTRPEPPPAPEEEEGRRPIERALFRPEWREDPDAAPAPAPAAALATTWLVLRSGTPLDDTVNHLRDLGAEVVTAEPGPRFARLAGSRYALRPGAREDYDRLIDALAADGLLPRRVLHGWLFGPPADAVDTNTWLDRGYFSVLFLAQALSERAPSHVPGMRWDVVGSRMRAVSGAEPVEPARTAVSGLCDVMAKELPGVAVRCVDLAEERFTAGLMDELGRADGPDGPDRFVAMRGRRRWTLAYRNVPPPRSPGAVGPLRERGTYLITGGLGGIGLTVAEGLARAVRARLVLTARSAFPPRDDWDRLLAEGPDRAGARVHEILTRLRKIEEYGAEVLVRRADAADGEAMRAAVDAAEREFGPVHGVFHAAGVPGGGLLALKTRAEAEQVMSAKVGGTLVLDRLLGDRVELMVLCSSITSVAGNLGQADYAAANAFLDGYAHARAADHPGFTVSVNWDAWSEVGMAATAEQLAPSAFRALQAGAATGGSLASDRPTVEPAPGVHPLLGERSEGADGETEYRVTMDATSHWLPREHRVAGIPVWPATAFLEMARAAGADALGLPEGVPLTLDDVTFVAVLTLAERRTLRTTLTPERDGGFRFRIASRAGGEDWTEHATGLIRASAAAGRPPVHDLEVLRECFPVVKPDSEPYDPEIGLVDFGPRWTSMAEIRRDESSTLARIELPPEYAGELADYPLHPALFDAATSNVVYLPELGPTGESYLPFTISGVTVRAALPPLINVYARRRGTHRNLITFDITVTDDAGREVADVTGYTVRVWRPDDFRGAVADLASSPPDSEASPAGIGGEFAISPEEGLRALWHILGERIGPQVVVVPEGVHARLRSVERLTQDVIAGDAAPDAAGTPAPAPEAAATGTVEERLLRLWSDALGIDGVGVDDDFFALGGNSLVAVQLAARVRGEFDAELPIATLIRHPTVREVAGIITS